MEGTFSAFLEVKSAWPVEDVRVPGFEAAATIDRLDEGHLRLEIQTTDARLDRDLVIYYRLREDLPGRVEVIPYRAEGDAPGTFMMVVTPGLDLRPLDRGADYLFILDVSGSMQTKIHTLARGVAKALGEMSPEDRLRVVAFANRAREVTRGWTAATPANVAAMTRTIETLQAGGSTNLFAGLSLGLGGLDADRATSVILVTDGVTNTGVVAPDAFHKLMKQFDVRVFGFLMGNSANWPLMRTICDASGGFYAGVSNADDIIGQLLLAKSKITHECLHDAELRITGARVFDTTGGVIGKVYRGQQLVIFGRYDEPGAATFTLDARLTGEDRRYTTTFELPEIDSDNPEIERLWALSRIEEIEAEENRGHLPAGEARSAIGDLGVTYQLVTDHTSMIVLSDDAFEKRGIERRNRERIARERQAQSVRAGRPARSHRVDGKNPAFRHRAPSVGGGAVDPLTGVIALALAALAAGAARRRLRIARGEEDA
ncbi:MAG: VWA domain-containing protein [Planctomycetota bacterium]